MFSFVPDVSLANAFEIICCFFTIIVAFASYFLTVRV